VYLTFVIILSCVFENNQFRFACKVYQTIKERVDFDLFYMNDGFDSSLTQSKNAGVWDPTMKLPFFFLPVSAHLVKLYNVSSDDRVLDVACGTGNTAITASRKGAKVTGIDITPQMLTRAKAETTLAEADDIKWVEGDTEDLPFEDVSFDVVLSSFGHMFAPQPKDAIRENDAGYRTGWPYSFCNLAARACQRKDV
jgi:SAM-dependent methyltransferase